MSRYELYSIMKKFTDLGLSETILRAVQDKGYDTPSPIQAKAIPAVLSGRDILAAAQTGTGKTAGFTLPVMQILEKSGTDKNSRSHSLRALVLTPTRELAAQVHDSVKTYGKHTSLRSLVVFGGVKISPQVRQLKEGVDILVATPGRLLDLCNQGVCKLDKIEILVLDEADRMLDMGFINDIRKLIKLMPNKRQNLLFSATFSKEIRTMTRELLADPITIEVTPKNTAAQTVAQCAYRCDAGAKMSITAKLIQDGNWEQVLVFTRTKHGANRLSKSLDQAGIQSSAIHGNKSQAARVKALAGFKNGTVRVLVATDIAARGIDIVQLPHVINYELPNVPEDYVHRIGRTGRAGQEGEAISLVCNDERPFLQEIEKIIGQKISLTDIEGFTPKLWPSQGPTTKEVQRAAEARKKASRQGQGRKSPSGTGKGKSHTEFNPSAGNKSRGRKHGGASGAGRRKTPRGR